MLEILEDLVVQGQVWGRRAGGTQEEDGGGVGHAVNDLGSKAAAAVVGLAPREAAGRGGLDSTSELDIALGMAGEGGEVFAMPGDVSSSDRMKAGRRVCVESQDLEAGTSELLAEVQGKADSGSDA